MTSDWLNTSEDEVRREQDTGANEQHGTFLIPFSSHLETSLQRLKITKIDCCHLREHKPDFQVKDFSGLQQALV